ncbi:MAG: hypothetical protein RMK92_11140, partial [Armatimonadota bacterium]|nr:hypothetical protein [Armatimonadota bacterium]
QHDKGMTVALSASAVRRAHSSAVSTYRDGSAGASPSKRVQLEGEPPGEPKKPPPCLPARGLALERFTPPARRNYPPTERALEEEASTWGK